MTGNGESGTPAEDAQLPGGAALGRQLRNILDAEAAVTARTEDRITLLEEQGYRIVDGGQADSYGSDGASGYVCTDWRTGETLFTGRGTYADYLHEMDAAAARDGREWCHRDRVDEVATGGEHDELALLDPARVPGFPGSLVQALVDWVEGSAAAGEVAALAGLPEARVRELLRKPARR